MEGAAGRSHLHLPACSLADISLGRCLPNTRVLALGSAHPCTPALLPLTRLCLVSEVQVLTPNSAQPNSGPVVTFPTLQKTSFWRTHPAPNAACLALPWPPRSSTEGSRRWLSQKG